MRFESGALAELAARDQWVVWKKELRGGKPTKVPYDAVRGGHAAVDDVFTWTSYENAVAVVAQGGYDGVGFVLTEQDPYVGLDLDHCIDAQGRLAEWAEKLLLLFDSYAERTPSGTGLRIWIKGVLPPEGHVKQVTWEAEGETRKGAIELYDRGRFFTFTGQRLPSMPDEIRERGEALTTLHAGLFPPKAPRPAPAAVVGPAPNLEDQTVLAAMFSAKNGAEVALLWQGHCGSYGSQSEADAALCCHLAFYTQDRFQIDRLFRRSGLMREKWDEKHYGDGRTYGEATIEGALSLVRETYTPPAPKPPPAVDDPGYHAQAEAARDRPMPEDGPTDPPVEEATDPRQPAPDTDIGSLYDRVIAPHLYTAFTLQTETIDPLVWVVDDFLPEGLTMISGNAKLGKTFLATGIAGPLAIGGKVFGRIDVTKGAVLYLGLEDGKRRTKDRLESLFLDDGITWPTEMTIIHGWPRMNQQGLPLLVEHMRRQPDTKLVVLDTWNAIRAPHSRGGDIILEDYMPFEQLAKLANQHHCAIVVIHHDSVQRKPDMVNSGAGSSGMAAAVNTYWHFTRVRGEHEAQLEITGHDVPEGTWQFQRDERTGFWTLLGDTDVILKTRERQEVYDLLTEQGPLTIAETMRALFVHTGHRRNRGTLGNLMRRMEKAGQLVQDERERYSTLCRPGGNLV